MRWIVGITLVLAAAGAPAQVGESRAEPPQRSAAERMRQLQEKAWRLIRATRKLENWDEQYESIIEASEKMFERNGWDTESDLFTLDMIREVGRIPPWKTQERFEAAMQMIGDRYLLDEGQMATIQNEVFRINLDLFSKHADRILQYATEAIETRAAGKPFTPEQIARWSRLAEPVLLDARQEINAAAEKLMDELDPEQQELVRQDLEAANRRMADIERAAQRWKAGQWNPADWGMEDDPIQNPQAAFAAREQPESPNSAAAALRDRSGGHAPGAATPAETRARHRPVTSAPAADDAWARYVREFIRTYKLNDEQRQRAWLYYRDAKQRDAVAQRRLERVTQSIRQRAGDDQGRAEAALRKPRRQRQQDADRLFERLKKRLDRLPTRAQRRAARSVTLPQRPTSARSSRP